MGGQPSDTLHGHPDCRDCPERTEARPGCRVVQPDGSPLDAFLARERCPLTSHLHRVAAAYLARRPHGELDRDDLVHEVVARLLGDEARRHSAGASGLPAFLAYLRRIVVSCAIGAERRQRGRLRCGSCAHFAAYSRLCLAAGHAWTGRRLPAATDPRTLDPPCARFEPARDPAPLDPDLVARRLAADDEPDPVAAEVDAALVALAVTHPRAALVVRARLLEGRSYEDLARLGVSVRTLKRDYAEGLAVLRDRLGHLAPRGDSAGPLDAGRAFESTRRRST